AKNPQLPRVVPTYLALHAVPPEAASSRDAYVAAAAKHVAEFAHQELAQFVDAYVDANAFSVAEAETVAHAARANGVGIRIHAKQSADVGTAALAARLGAASADHLEHVSRRDLDLLAAAGTRTVLLPVASFTLGQSPPPVADIRAADVAIMV